MKRPMRIVFFDPALLATKPVRILIRIGGAWMLLAMAYLVTYAVFLNVAPMSFWIDYSGLEVLESPGGAPERVRVDRVVKGDINTVVPITRFIELHERQPDGTVTQWCPSVDWTTAETRTNPQVTVFLADFMGSRCDLNALEGRRVFLQVTYDLELPYSVHKRKNFYAGPFTISGGNLRPVAMLLRPEIKGPPPPPLYPFPRRDPPPDGVMPP